jgi:hypothetical protein
MPLSPDEIFVMRGWVGTTPSDAELQAIYDVVDGYDATVLYVLNQRRVNLSLQPASLSVPGLSVSHGSDLQALEALIDDFRNGGGTGLEEDSTLGMQIQSIRRDFCR